MGSSKQILFIQGGGAGVHDGWDNKLVDSLAGALGHGYRIRYPHMPQEDDPSRDMWSASINRELEALEDGAVAVGHSVGGTILISTLADGLAVRSVGVIVLIAAPFVGAGGWSVPGFGFSPDLGAKLPPDTPVHLFHGSADQSVPPSHMDLYARAIPKAHPHLLPGRDHQLNDDLSDIAALIDGSQADARPRS